MGTLINNIYNNNNQINNNNTNTNNSYKYNTIHCICNIRH